MIVSSRSTRPLSEVVVEAKTPLWFQVYPESDMKATLKAAQDAIRAGCKAVCLTIGAPQPDGNLKIDWAAIDELRKGLKAPLILKGIMNPQEAKEAAAKGIQGVVVSNHGGIFVPGFAEPIEMLPSIVEAVGGKIPVLVDGSFRRGTNILKALASGASAVLIGRPAVWGLAAYGSEGVQAVVEMLQSELARNMALCGKPNIRSLDSSLLKIHRR